MVDPDKIDYKPCPNCGGKIIHLGEDIYSAPVLLDATEPIHTLMCINCQAMWDIEVKTDRLQDAWEDICNKEAD